jgi:DNA polymerase-3 subunit gamma/tau
VLQDLLELSHFVTRLKLAPEAGTGDPIEEGERERARPIAALLSMPVLARAWQMLLKGLEEVQTAPAPAQAAAMVLVRLAYVADLPVPADLVRALTSGSTRSAETSPDTEPRASGPRAPTLPSSASGGGLGRKAGETPAVQGAASPALAVALPQPAPTAPPPSELDPLPQSFAETVALFDKRREAVIAAHLKANVRLVSFEPGRIEIRPTEAAPSNLTNQLGQLLGEWTGTRWIVAISQAEGSPSLAEEEAQRASALRHEVAAHPLVRAVLETFPGATIAAVRERFVAADAGIEAPSEDVGDDGADVEEDGS